MSRQAIILVAGGRGTRFGTAVPKQFLQLDGLPIYVQTMKQFMDYDAQIQLILVLPFQTSDEELANNKLELERFFGRSFYNCRGGMTRFDSVKNGLQLIEEQIKVVGIHDAVRPLVSQSVIDQCFSTAAKVGNAIPVIDVVQSLREVDGDINHAVDRSHYRIVQTPQCFQKQIIMTAYQQENKPEFTDDATVVEYLGHKIKMVPGNYENIKITTPPDLLYAEYLLQQRH